MPDTPSLISKIHSAWIKALGHIALNDDDTDPDVPFSFLGMTQQGDGFRCFFSHPSLFITAVALRRILIQKKGTEFDTGEIFLTHTESDVFGQLSLDECKDVILYAPWPQKDPLEHLANTLFQALTPEMIFIIDSSPSLLFELLPNAFDNLLRETLRSKVSAGATALCLPLLSLLDYDLNPSSRSNPDKHSPTPETPSAVSEIDTTMNY